MTNKMGYSESALEFGIFGIAGEVLKGGTYRPWYQTKDGLKIPIFPEQPISESTWLSHPEDVKPQLQSFSIQHGNSKKNKMASNSDLDRSIYISEGLVLLIRLVLP